MKKRLIDLWWKVDHSFERRLPLVLLFALVVFLRIPSYFEPYWYGDESIYLTVGTALNQGKTLYRDIVDHKTPIIYYLARVPNQLSFRILLTLWMFPVVAAFFFITTKVLKKKRLAWIATATLIVATTLPTFEGMIPNGELFVLGFFLPGLALLYSVLHTAKLQQYPSLKASSFFRLHQLIALARCTLNLKKQLLLIVAGFLFGCAVLTKVPAIFDVIAAYLLVAFFILGIKRNLTSKKLNLSRVIQLLVIYFWLTLGFATPIVISVAYFTLLGAFSDYLAFGLLYNFHYTSTWVPTSTLPIATLFFSLKGKLLILSGITFIVVYLRKKLPPIFLFAIAWTWWSAIAASLSNRPYPHYFIQVIPAVLFLLFVFIDTIPTIFQKKLSQLKTYGIQSFLFTVTIGMLIFINITLGLWSNRYSTTKYYQRFLSLLNGSVTLASYQDSFDSLVADNRQAAKLIKSENPNEIFIWGTNPSLYAQTHTSPANKFTVLFHVADLGLYQETVEAVVANSPEFFIVMKNAEDLPAPLQRYLVNNYSPAQNLEYMAVWQRRSTRY